MHVDIWAMRTWSGVDIWVPKNWANLGLPYVEMRRESYSQTQFISAASQTNLSQGSMFEPSV